LISWVDQFNTRNLQHPHNACHAAAMSTEESTQANRQYATEMNAITPLGAHDHDAALEIYRDAVETVAPAQYSQAQVKAWSQQGRSGSGITPLRNSLRRGWGLVSRSADGEAEAFALLDPIDRVALLYCRGRSCREGRGGALLQALEQEARRRGIPQLRTEASLISEPLFRSQGWQVSWQEELLINGVLFQRFRMAKPLNPAEGALILN
jgi:GNAT superfamily N-acetyltransferase